MQSLPCGETGGAGYVMNPSGSWPSYLLGGEKLSRGTIDALAGRMKSGELPAFWIRAVAPGDRFGHDVTALGIRQINDWAGMWLERDKPFGRLAPDRESTLERITGERELREWLDVVNHEVMSGKTIDFRLFRKALSEPEFNFFRILRGKKTVATLLSFREGSAIGIYMVSTRTELRGMGFGTWITSEAVDYFIRKGFRKFVLHSTTAGYPVYKKLGFQENGRYGIYWMVGKF